MATRNARSAARRIEFVIGEPTGLLDSPLGADLRRLEEKIRAGDRAGIEARWQFGRRLLVKRGDAKQLPDGLQAAIVEQHGISRSEVLHRIRFAEKYPEAEQVSNMLDTWRTWRDITQNALYEKRVKKPNVDNPKVVSASRLEVRRLRKNLAIARHRITPAFAQELLDLVALITEVLETQEPQAR